jgi:hypothetical protein
MPDCRINDYVAGNDTIAMTFSNITVETTDLRVDGKGSL